MRYFSRSAPRVADAALRADHVPVACPSGLDEADPRLTWYEPVADCCFAAQPSVATGGGVTLARDELRASDRPCPSRYHETTCVRRFG